MCTNPVVLVPKKQNGDSAMQKTCKPAMLGRMWQASRQALNLEYKSSHEFARSQWQDEYKPSNVYLVYRWILFVTTAVILVTSFAYQKLPSDCPEKMRKVNYFKFFIYFTNWGFILIGLQAALALAVVHRFRGTSCDEGGVHNRRPRTPLLCRAYWITYTIATDLAFVITLIYWTMVFNPDKNEIDLLNLLVHVGNSVVMLIELGVTAHPIKAAHALYGAGAGLAYGIFSAFYWVVGGTEQCGKAEIYSKLDWTKPGSAIGFVTLCAVVMVVAHAFATGLAKVRTRLAKRLRRKSPQPDLLPKP